MLNDITCLCSVIKISSYCLGRLHAQGSVIAAFNPLAAETCVCTEKGSLLLSLAVVKESEALKQKFTNNA